MRITGGEFRGRIIKSPNTNGTRPVTDRVREALFSVLGPIEHLSVLDVYAGSGILGFEALSRGARSVMAVESARMPIEAIHENSKKLAVGSKYTLYPFSVETFLAQRAVVDKFDVILADPPYSQIDWSILQKLSEMLGVQGVLVVSHTWPMTSIDLPGMEILVNKSYGGSGLTFYRKPG